MKSTRKLERTEGMRNNSLARTREVFADDVNGEPRSESNMDWEGGALQQPPKSVAERAYELWLEEGCPPGRDLEHWIKAERELQANFQ